MTDTAAGLGGLVGGRWFGSWATWVFAAVLGLVSLTSDLVASGTLMGLLQWLAVWVLATGASAFVLVVAQHTVLRRRHVSPIPTPLAIALSGAYGMSYGVAIWVSAVLIGVPTSTDWPLRIGVLTLWFLWLIPLFTIALATINEERARRHADIEALVALQTLRLREGEVAIELRAQVHDQVIAVLDPLRQRVTDTIRDLDAMTSSAGLDLARDMRESAVSAVRPLSQVLWSSAAVHYPKPHWAQIFTSTITTQPIRTWALVALTIAGDGVFVIANHGIRGVLYAGMTALAVASICAGANALMRARPRKHATWFALGLLALLVLDAIAPLARGALWGEPYRPALILAAMVLTTCAVLITSAFGAWATDLDRRESAFRSGIDAGVIEELARSHELAAIAREAAQVLHGSVQTRLMACAISLESARTREELTAALAEAKRILEEPIPSQLTVGESVETEVSRKVALWGDVCVFHVTVDPRVEGMADPLAVGRVVEEGITNAVRHGSAETIHVDVQAGQTAVIVQIRDDGIGFSGGQPGLGSALLQQSSHGDWTLERISDETVLTVRIPVASGQASPAYRATHHANATGIQ